MNVRVVPVLVLALAVVTAGCDPDSSADAGEVDSGPGAADAGPDSGARDAGADAGRRDAGAGDAGSGMLDAGCVVPMDADVPDGSVLCASDAGGADAGLDAGSDAGPDDGGACIADASLDADLPDGAVRCPAMPPLMACPSATPALDFVLTMVTSTPGGGSTSEVRGRHTLASGLLAEQRVREQMSTPAVTDLLRIWRSSSPTTQLIYSIQPATPDPSTFEPKARRDTAATPGVLNGLATFPTYATELLACLGSSNPAQCLDDRPLLTDLGMDDTVGGDRCRVMEFAADGLRVCIPDACDARRTLYPYWVEEAGSGIRVEFRDPRPMTHADAVVVEPAPCVTITGGIVLCDHPDL